MHVTAAHRASVGHLRRTGRARRARGWGVGALVVVALVVAALGGASKAMPAAAAASRLSLHSGPGQRASSAASSCQLYGTDQLGYWSSCFPKLNMAIAWNGFAFEGQDIGSELGTQATSFYVFKDVIVVRTEQSSSLHERDQIKAQLEDPDCGEVAKPTYDGHGKGLLETPEFADDFQAWLNGVPKENAYWGPNVPGYTVSYPNCQGSNIPLTYEPGTPLAGDKCSADPRKDPLFNLYYGKHSETGTLTQGVHDSWDFDCNFSPNGSWKSSGKFTMAENPCPRITKGTDVDPLRPSTKRALAHLYQGLEERGGCFRFRLGWTSPQTHAQNVDIVAGFRPMGLQAFANTEKLRQYIVPVMHSIAKAAGLCGPTRADPVKYQTPYRTGTEKKPSCHLD